VTTVFEPQGVKAPTIRPGHDAWFRWVRAHGSRKDLWQAHRIVLAFIDPALPPTPLPPWVFLNYLHGDRLTVRRVRLPRQTAPEFQVITLSGRDLGRIVGIPAEMIRFMRAERIEPRVCVLVSDPSLPSQDRLQLDLEIEAWFAPGEPVTMPLVFDERAGE
jgi:hypothetical protein